MVSITLRGICHLPGFNNLLLILFCLMITGCQKEEIMKLANVPKIQVVSISHDTIRQYEDVLLIRIFYQDGNGDLGFEDPQEYALFVRDIRLQTFDGFYVGPLTPPEVEVPIQGELTVEFPALFLFGNGKSEQTWFEIKMIDRAGNESNLVETSPITITRE